MLSAPIPVLGAFAIALALRLPDHYEALLATWPSILPAFRLGQADLIFRFAAWTFGIGGGIMILAGLLGFIRRPFALSLLRKAYALYYAMALFGVWLVFRITGEWMSMGIELVERVKLDAVRLAELRWIAVWPYVVVLPVLVFLHVFAWRRRTMEVYGWEWAEAQAPGDRILESIRSEGRDPQYRRSWLSSVTLHAAAVFGPLLLALFGCVTPYRVPKGSGTPTVAMVAFVQPQEIEPRKYILREDSPISFYQPDLDDSEVLVQVDMMSRVTYEADPNARPGAMGEGGGTEGGWPDGMEDHLVRFIRLEYRGQGWNDGMDDFDRSDLNFLDEFRRLTGFNVARQTESHPMARLRRYPKGYAPPFVYMTGYGGSISTSARDREILREYLEGGGMLFADAGSPAWDRAFRSFMGQVFPGEPLRVIADDDPIFQIPYRFPNGAPPLWHHGGRRALGIRRGNRWAVFYPRGDVKDTWRTGHSGLPPHMARGGFQIGINVVYHAFTHYLAETARYRK